MIHGVSATNTVESYRAAAEEWVKAGMPLMAYEAASAGLQQFPEDVRLTQLQALALARGGAPEAADQILRRLVECGHKDAETCGMLARTRKDLWLKAQGTPDGEQQLRDAQALYRWGYDNAVNAGDREGAIYTGINSAATSFLLGDKATACQLAAAVRELCRQSATRDYWTLASDAEAALITGEWQEAARLYSEAARMAGAPANVSTTRHQARLLLAAMGQDASALDSALPVPAVIAVHNRVSLAEEQRRDLILRRAREAAGRLAGSIVYFSVASADDCALAQAFVEAGHEVHVVVASRGGDLAAGALHGCAELVVAGKHTEAATAVGLRFAELMRDGLALMRAESLETAWSVMALEPCSDSVQLVPAQWMPATLAQFEPNAQPGTAREVLRAFLIVRVVGTEELADDHVPAFAESFLRAIADVQRHSHFAPVLKNTYGADALFVFRSVRDAGRFALELRDAVAMLDLAAKSLPEKLGLKMALHAGPVFDVVDAASSQHTLLGSRVVEAMQLAKVAPAGMIYGSESFAALAAAQQVHDFRCSAAGAVPGGRESLPVYFVGDPV